MLARQPFWVNLLAALFVFFLLIFLFLKSLGWLTSHGSYLKVPAVKGKNVDEAVKLLEDRGFEVVIQDSVYFDSIPKFTVIKQLPDPDATVKANRTVFLTINRALPPSIDMPKLEGLSFKFAVNMLERNHLRLGDTSYRADFMKGSVLEQQYNGARIAAGTPVPWGSKVELVIGAGLQDQRILVPDLLGMNFDAAKEILKEKGINLAATIFLPGITDSANAFIYKQNPEKMDEDKNLIYIQPGQTMDLWLSPTPPNLDSLRNNNPDKNVPNNF
ncbi:MAG: PASTA domain-containing protein [Chitinophagaceae bacterium]|nr:PASTA domain-containing protein [Chitinophagaceae bacterium]